jgi:hypothetical protein
MNPSALLRRSALLLALLVAPPAGAQSAEDLALAQRLVQRSGLTIQLDGMVKQMPEQFRAHAKDVPPEMVPTFIEAAKAAFVADALEAHVRQALATKMKRGDMQAAITWLETPAGRRVTVAEEQSAHTMNDQTLGAYAAQLRKKPLTDARGRLIGEIITVSLSMDAMVRMQQSMALGIAIGMDSTQPAQSRVGPTRLKTEVHRLLPASALRAAMEQTLPIIMAYTYRDVSDADLVSYRRFLQSEAGKRYNVAVMDALETAIVRASVRMGELLDQPGAKRGT